MGAELTDAVLAFDLVAEPLVVPPELAVGQGEDLDLARVGLDPIFQFADLHGTVAFQFADLPGECGDLVTEPGQLGSGVCGSVPAAVNLATAAGVR